MDAGSGDKAGKNSPPAGGASESGSGSAGGGKAGLKPSPALLAELLKGSSEKMVSEQRKKTIAVSSLLRIRNRFQFKTIVTS